LGADLDGISGHWADKDYGSNVESEMEVFGLIARSSSDFRAFSYLAIVLSLFESGRLTESPSGFFRR
jgi:hypothetical protein